jgi:hypothetical protein
VNELLQDLEEVLDRAVGTFVVLALFVVILLAEIGRGGCRGKD